MPDMITTIGHMEPLKRFFPGSRQEIAPVAEVPTGPERWDDNPYHVLVRGEPMELFDIRALARALNRSVSTIRRWEADGVIPKATYRKPSKDPRGRRRLYSREQILGIRKIALEEGIFTIYATAIQDTKFSQRVLALFKELAAKR